MLAEQILRIVSGIFVGIYIARHLGPEQFGILSYVLAISAIAMAISRLGMDAVLVRELVSNPQKKEEYLGTAFWLMSGAGVVCYLIIGLTIWASSETDEIKKYALIVATSTAFTSFLSIDYHFQAQLKAKISTICKVLALAAVSIIKITLIYIDASLIWFVIASVLDHILLAIFLIIAMCQSHDLRFIKKYNKDSVLPMLKSAWPIVLSAIAGMILVRIDQVMIRYILDLHQVGIYAAAVKVFEAWIILPYILTVSLLPAIVRLRQGDIDNYHAKMVLFFRLIIWLSLGAAIAATLFSESLMVIAFGESYRESSSVVTIVMWATVFVAMGSLSARYFNVEHMEKKLLVRSIVAAILNIGMNFILIPLYGIEGAAISTLACFFVINYAMDWLDKDLKTLLNIKHQAIFPFLKKRKTP